MNKEHVEIIRQGAAAIRDYRKENPSVKFDLNAANLRCLDLREANLSDARFGGSDLSCANLSAANLRGCQFGAMKMVSANLEAAHLDGANITGSSWHCANLSQAAFFQADILLTRFDRANCNGTSFFRTKFENVSFDEAKLEDANISSSVVRDCSFNGAYLNKADLRGTTVDGANFTKADLSQCSIGNTTFARTDFARSIGLDSTLHYGRSRLDLETLAMCCEKPPAIFLKQCGIPPWIAGISRLFDPSLSPTEIEDVVYNDVFNHRVDGPLYLGGIFISYSSQNEQFAQKLYKALVQQNASIYLDKERMLAGSVEPQLAKAIRLNDVVVLVLSKASLQSDWVWHEIRLAREKEKAEARDVLCPIALDDAWERPENYNPQVQYAIKAHAVEMGIIRSRHVIDFSNGRTFQAAYKSLLLGLKLNYPRNKATKS